MNRYNKPFMLYCLNGNNDFEIKIFDKEPSDKEVFEYAEIDGCIDDQQWVDFEIVKY